MATRQITGTKVISVRGQLQESLYQRMMETDQLVTMKELPDFVVEVEQDNGVRMSDRVILLTYWSACDQAIDSWVTNAMETNDPNYDSHAEAKRYESMRPSSVRRKELLAKFAAE